MNPRPQTLPILLLIGSLLLISPWSAPAQQAPYKNIDSIRAEIDRLLPQIPQGFPEEELNKLTGWIDAYELKPGTHGDLTLKRIIAQLEYIKSILKRIDSEREITRLRGEIDALNRQNKELEDTNQDVLEEIERLERQ